MYTIKHKKCPAVLKNKSFKTYNEARQAVRKWLSAMFRQGKIKRALCDMVNRTFTIGYYGYSISAKK
jgi:hypothetical protein